MSDPVQLRDIHLEDRSQTGSMVNLIGSTEDSGSRLLYALILLIGLVSVVSIIIGAVSLSRPAVPNVTVNSGESKQQSGQTPITVVNSGASSGGNSGKKVWTIAMGHDFGPHEYIDPKGYLKGFGYDFLREVCQAAGIDCRTVWDKYTNCWDSTAGTHAFGGTGLFSRWYDACTAWAPSVDRIHVFSFTQSYLKLRQAYFYVKKGAVFDPTDITNKKIGFLDGWVNDEKCLARQNNIKGAYPMDKSNIFYVPDSTDLANAILEGTVVAGFSSDLPNLGNSTKLEKVGVGYDCALGGNAMMTRKDSDFIPLWNKGFAKLREGGRFAEICQKGQKEHSAQGTFMCVDS